MAQKRENTHKAEKGMSAAARVVTPADLGLTEDLCASCHVAPIAVAQYIRALQQNWRQGTVHCKDRSEVARSGKKPFKQKGTGRARAGTARSPLWRGGGTIFGPQPRTRVLATPVALRRSVLAALLHDALKQERIMVCEDLMLEKPSTRAAAQLIQHAGCGKEQVLFFTGVDDRLVHASFANVPTVSLLLFDQPNGYALLRGSRWLLLQKDFNLFKEMVQRWI